MNRYVLVAVFAAASAFSSSAYSAAAVCNDCNLGKKQTISRELGVGNHYLWDFNGRAVYHMVVSNSGGGGTTLSLPTSDYYRMSSDTEATISVLSESTVKEVNLTTAEQNGAAAGFAVYDANGGSIAVSATLPVDIAVSETAQASANRTVARASAQETTRSMTAMDAVTTPAYRDAAVQFALSETTLGPYGYFVEQLRTALTNLTSVLNIGPIQSPITLINIIRFPDQSYFKIQWSFTAHAYTYVKGSAVDAAGNPIPETRAEVTGGDGGTRNYVYPNSPNAAAAGASMVDHITDLGVRWNGPNNVKVYTSYMLACSSTPSGANCQVIPLTM